MSGHRNVEVAGEECRGWKTGGGYVNDDMKLHGLQPEWAVFRDICLRVNCAYLNSIFIINIVICGKI